MIEISMVFLFLYTALIAFVASAVSYWLGRDAGEKAQFVKRWDEQTEHMERLQRLMAENHRLRKQVETLAEEMWLPENVWNNARNVPDQPR